METGKSPEGQSVSLKHHPAERKSLTISRGCSKSDMGHSLFLLPSGKLTYENHCFQSEYSIFLSSFSIAILNDQRVSAIGLSILLLKCENPKEHCKHGASSSHFPADICTIGIPFFETPHPSCRGYPLVN